MEKHCNPQQVCENVACIRDRVAKAAIQSGRSLEDVRIMAVTKTIPASLVNVAIEEGITLLGENRVQEYLSKKDQYLPQAEVHFIGHLQSNKIKYLIDHVTMIQSVSSYKTAEKINQMMGRIGKKMDILLEVNIAQEESKSGIAVNEIPQFLENMGNLNNISLKGLMCIPPFGNSEEYFCRMNELLVDIKGKKLDNINMNILSMGMSADYEAAIRQGSTLIRLGTTVFGQRDYSK